VLAGISDTVTVEIDYGAGGMLAWVTISVLIPLSDLQSYARDAANLTRCFLAVGYVIVVPTYRSRVVDPQSRVSLEDSLAAASIVVFGCSGGGDLALEVAARTKICAVVPEEPAIMLMAGMFTTATPKKGERYDPTDSFFLLRNSKQYYTPKIQKFFRAKLDRIECPTLLVQGQPDKTGIPMKELLGDILIPELRAARKMLTVSTYAEQLHCFCFSSGLPLKGPIPAPASWQAAALHAFSDIDAFCRRYVKTQPKAIDSSLITYVAVRR
jgi:pimeloyl-ACP methyl ester carboxylesterase